MIKAVIFDFGRVITVQKPPSLFQAWEEELGLSPGELNAIMYESEAWDLTQVGAISDDEYWRRIGPRLGLDSLEEVAQFKARYFAQDALEPVVVDLVRRARARYRVALLSNASDLLGQWLEEKLGIAHLFDVVINSAEVGVKKPDPRIYLLTLERLGVEPHEAVFIDDVEENVEAAAALGIQAIHFTTPEDLEKELEELLDLNST